MSKTENPENPATESIVTLKAINTLFEETLKCETEEEVAAKCLSISEDLTNSKFGFLGEINPKTGLFDTLAISNPGWDACKMSQTQARKEIVNMPLRGIDRGALRDGKSRIVNDPSHHPEHVAVPKGHPEVKCFLGVPFKEGNKVVGMIGLGNKEGGYTEEDQRVIEALAFTFLPVLKRKRAEERLRESEEKFRILFEKSSLGILMADPETKEFGYANPAICRMLGYTQEELLHLEMADIHPKNSLDHVVAEFEAQIRGEKTLAPALPCMRKDGTVFFVDITSVPLVYGGQKYMVGFFLDVTERKQMEDELKRLNLELERRVAERTKELKERMDELEIANSAMMGREERIMELKEEVARLKEQLSRR